MAKTVLDYRKDRRASLVAVLVALIENWEGLRESELERASGLKPTTFEENLPICVENGWAHKQEDGRYRIVLPDGIKAYQDYFDVIIKTRISKESKSEIVMVPLDRINIGAGPTQHVFGSGYVRAEVENPDEMHDDFQNVIKDIGNDAQDRIGRNMLTKMANQGMRVKKWTFVMSSHEEKDFDVVKVECKTKKNPVRSSHSDENTEWIEGGNHSSVWSDK